MSLDRVARMPTDKRGVNHIDFASLLVALLSLTMLIFPANLVLVGPLRSNGSISKLIAFILLVVLLTLLVLRRRSLDLRLFSIDTSLIVLLAYSTISLGVANFRILDEIESSGSVRGLLVVVVCVSAALSASSLIRTRHQIRTVLAAIIIGATISAVAGFLQSRAGFNPYQSLEIPGFTLNAINPQSSSRSGFTRVYGSAEHPIEFAVTLAACVPLALHFCRFAGSGLRRFFAITGTALLVLAVPMSVSRSGIVALVVGLIVYSLCVSWKARLWALVLFILFTGLYRIVRPGLFRAVTSLFVNASSDTSITGRTEDYPLIFELVDMRFWTGLGIGTFRPERFFFLDNQWLLTIVEGGAVGLAVLTFVVVASVITAARVARSAVAASERSLAYAVGASVVALAGCGFTFDLMSFQEASLLLFLMVGAVSALSKLANSSTDLELSSSYKAALS